jgi:hypothetical protein
MTESLPPLVVRVDREELVRLRRKARRLLLATAIGSIVVGVLLIAMISIQLVSGIGVGPLAFLLLLASAYSLVYGGYLFGVVTMRQEFWSGEDTGDIAFTMSSNGVEFTFPRGLNLGVPYGTSTVTAPWESVLSVTTNKRMLVFTTAPGTLPAKMRNAARYGLPVLTESPDTVRAAERALRTGVMPAVTARS